MSHSLFVAPLLPSPPLSVRFYCCCFLSPEVNPRWLQRGVTLHQAVQRLDCSSCGEKILFKGVLGLHEHVLNMTFNPKSFSSSRCVSPMLLAPEAWGEVSQVQAPMGRPVTQHALLLLQCMLVLRPGGVASRRGPVLLPESPCHKTEHPLIPHSGECSRKHTHTRTQQGEMIDSTH